MTNVLVWEPSSSKVVAKVLFSLSPSPEIWTSCQYDDPVTRQSSIDYAMDAGLIHSRSEVSFDVLGNYVVDDPFLASKKLVRIAVRSEGEITILVNEHWAGMDVFFFSEQVAPENVCSFLERNKGVDQGLRLLRNIKGVSVWCRFSAWFGLPDWDRRRNLVLVSDNHEMLNSIVERAVQCGERFLESVEAAERFGRHTDSKMYFADFEHELRRYGVD